jgi:hypothetical protein
MEYLQASKFCSSFFKVLILYAGMLKLHTSRLFLVAARFMHLAYHSFTKGYLSKFPNTSWWGSKT